MTQHPRRAFATDGHFELVTRPLRMYAAFMTIGAEVCAVMAIVLLAQSGAGVTTFAEGRTGTAIRIPAEATEPLIIYAVDIPGAPPLNVDCTMSVWPLGHPATLAPALTCARQG